MPHLYLPSDHTDKDLILAADVASAVASADLYVTWTLDAGQGTPDVEAVVRDEQPERPVNPFAELMVALFQGVATLWQALTGPPAPRIAAPRAPEVSGRPASEPSV